MAKIDIGIRQLARFYEGKGNSEYLQKFINQDGVLRCNNGWYLTQGDVDPSLTPTSDNGDATFKVRTRTLNPATLMSMRAPLGEGYQGDHEGIEWYTASIPDFAADGFRETATERFHRMELLRREFGNDADLVDQYLDKVQVLYDSLDMTMTYMSAQLSSTGFIDYSKIGRGIQEPLYDAKVPKESFRKGGALAWNDAKCDLLEQMRQTEEGWREAHIEQRSVKLVWQMTKNDFNKVFLKNKQVAEIYKSWAAANYVGFLQNYGPNREMFLKSVVDLNGLSSIEIVDEIEHNKRFDGAVSEIHGWNDGTVVLRPAGKPLRFMRKEILDRRIFDTLGNKLIDVAWATTNNGLGLLRNMVTANGMYKEFKTDLFLASVPAMLDSPYRWIIDITKKDGQE